MPATDILFKMAKTVGVFLFASFMAIVFLFSGLLINAMQALLYLALYNRNRRLYRKINYYLIYTCWAQVLAVCEWWSNTRCNMYGEEEALEKFGKEHCIIVMNHKYDLDWLICWFICDKLGMLGNAKTCAKKPLRNIPVIGFGWVFAEMIFLERNWEKDKECLGPKLDKLAEYEDPIMILYFCEGTRFTPEKHENSLEFARKHNLPLLKHHLSPRTRGFNFTVKHLKEKIPAVYDIELAFPEGAVKPTFSNLLRGHGFVGDLHLRRIPMSQVPTDSDEETSAWLHKIYQDKDQLMDDYFRTGVFPGRCIRINRAYRSLLTVLFWSAVVGLPTVWGLLKLLLIGNVYINSLMGTLFAIILAGMYFMVRATKASKGSSYGAKKSPEKIMTTAVEDHNGTEKNGKLTEKPNGGSTGNL